MIINPIDCVFSLDEAKKWRESLRAEGKKLVMTNGCFDLLHRGHVTYLFNARSKGDALIVAVNGDQSVRELKGPSRPVNSQDDRAYVLAGLACVDAVTIFEGQRCVDIIRNISPDIYAKGGDYTLETLDPDERSALIDVGAEITLIPFVEGFSTTNTLAKTGNSD